MKIVYREILDWEPANVTFFFHPYLEKEVPYFERMIGTWLRSDARRLVCGCRFRFGDFSVDPNLRCVKLRTEWMCPKCIEALVNLLERHFSNLSGVEIGSAPSDQGNTSIFLDIPSKTVRVESGSQVDVDAFSIGRYPVTTHDFEVFAQSTGYTTSAEKNQDRHSFRRHPAIFGLSEQLISRSPVSYVSFEDACAYCSFKEVRLPSEFEWLAAAVKDPMELDIDTSEELRLRLRPVPDTAMVSSDWDITATQSSDGKVVTRRGPLHFVKKNWRESREFAYHRRLIAPTEYDIMISFRIVKA